MTLKIQEMMTPVGSLRFCGTDNSDSVPISMRETIVDEKIYVAVTGKDLECKSSLVWAIKNTGGKHFCIVYVHQSIQISASKAHKNLDKYLHICSHMQVIAEKIYIEMESVEKGLLQLIPERGVKKLVMGAAADRHYSMKMRDLQSKKAIYIRNEAPATCQLWFTCNGYLICSREAKRRDNLYLESKPSSSVNQTEITRGTTTAPSTSITIDDDRIRVAVKEAEDLKKKARFEASKRKEAEEDARLEASKCKQAEEAARFEVSLRKEAVKAAKDAINKTEKSESLYIEERKHRRETEEALNEAIEEVERTRLESEIRIDKSNKVIRKLKGKYSLLREKQEELQRELRLAKLKCKDMEEEASSSSANREPPQYFICPITQDVMEDPYVAADGFTYEREAISGWFDRGHEISPMTNKRLPHTSLVPNRALRSAIKEWHQTSSS